MRKGILFLQGFTRKTGRDHVRAHSAEAAFFIIISVFPILMLLLTLLQVFPITVQDILNAVEEVAPYEVSEMLKPVLETANGQSIALVSWTAVAALWAAGKSVMGLADGLNTIYRIEETRNYFLMRFRAACYTLVLIVAIVVSLVVLVFGYGIRDFVKEEVWILQYLPDFGMIVPILLTMGILTLLFLMMYVFLPNRRMPVGSQLPGAIFAAVSWSVFSYAFSVYIELSGDMSVIYGSLTMLVVIMLWLYFCMYLLFIGAEINHYLMLPELFEPENELK